VTAETFNDAELRQAMHRVRTEVDKAVVGQAGTVTGLLVSLLARGHVLLEGVPGVAKTLVVRSFARALGLDTKRVQFTPDLMPGDVTGSLVYDARTGEFDFRAGPVFTNILLADEINRTPPKTQSALLEAMEERQVTIDSTTYLLEAPFMVIATQNPIEHEGTYPLPESQLDRFFMRVSVGYPDANAEALMLDAHGDVDALEGIGPVARLTDVRSMIAATKAVHMAPSLKGYLVQLADTTRRHQRLALGMSPRAVLNLQRAARSRAAAAGRSYVVPDDIKALAESVLAHRLVVTPEAQLAGIRPADVIREVLQTVPVPSGRNK
jgi:MoxR-like ATPase